MLAPKRTKYRKTQKGTTKGKEVRGVELSFGDFGLQAEASCWVNSRQIEAARKSIARFLQKKGRMWIRIFPYKPVTRKGLEMPMGGGKGAVDHYVYPVRQGKILFEIQGIDHSSAKKAFKKAAIKLPLKTKFIFKK
jgi:large subunit ribosomal protein L16